MESKIKFGQFVTQKRKEIGLTQKEFAQRLYVTESAVSKWERGISYPDISLVSDICRELQVTEHELITATKDYHQREIERQAKGFINIIQTYSAIFYAVYGISLLACFITNIAVFHTLSWFFIVLAAELVTFSLLNLPVIITKNRGLVTIGGSFVSINLLLFVCNSYTKGEWFFLAFACILCGYVILFLPYVLCTLMKPIGLGNHKALIYLGVSSVVILLTVIASCRSFDMVPWSTVKHTAVPITLIGLILPWLLLVIIRYIRLNSYFKTAICLFVSGIYGFCVNGVIDAILDKHKVTLPKVDFSSWNETTSNGNTLLIIMLSFFVLGIIFIVAEIMKETNIKKMENNHKSAS